MNAILSLQNQDDNVALLAAQRQMYSDAKQMMSLQLYSLLFVVFFSLLGVMFPGIQVWTVSLSIISYIVNFAFLSPRQKRLTQQAADVQETFDCNVLGLKWPESRAELQPEERVRVYAEKHRLADPHYSELKDWYEKRVREVPLPAARIVCQKINIQWDYKLRRRYATVLLIILLAFLVFLTIVSFLKGNVSLQGFLNSIIWPLSPAFVWVLQERRSQLETCRRLRQLNKQVDDIWIEVKTQSDELLETVSRAIQNEIYDHRRSAPLVFDWLYKRLRKKSEQWSSTDIDMMISGYQRM